MRGMSDEEGRSPFWESLGRHFFKMEFSQADYLTEVSNKAFIAELMPKKFPLYTCFLSEEARPDRRPSEHRAGAGHAQGRGCFTRATSTSSTPARRDQAETGKIRAIAESQEPGAGGGHSRRRRRALP